MNESPQPEIPWTYAGGFKEGHLLPTDTGATGSTNFVKNVSGSEPSHKCPSCGFGLSLAYYPLCQLRKCGKCEKPLFVGLAPRTQKATSVLALSGLAKCWRGIAVPKRVLLLQNMAQIVELASIDSAGGPGNFLKSGKVSASRVTKRVNGNHLAFVRPCPQRPRHGFVDSRPALSWRDVRLVMKETLEADPGGEILVQPMYDAKASAILNPRTGYLSLGKGNDGATSGKQTVDMIIPPEPIFGSDLSHLKTVCDILPEEDPYLEILVPSRNLLQNPLVVQARGGPKQSKRYVSDLYIPEPMEVKRVDTVDPATTNLLEWESICHDLASEEGVLVHLPGGSLVSHIAIHCIINEVPLCTSQQRPLVGMYFEPQERNTFDLKWSTFIHWYYHTKSWIGQDFMRLGRAASAGVALTHNLPQLSQMPSYSRLLAFACSSINLASTLSCWGEARYALSERQKQGKPGRLERWEECIEAPKWIQEKFLEDSSSLFHSSKEWEDGENTNVGGMKWARIATTALDLQRAIDRKKETAVKTSLNALVNANHNGGKGLNKLVDNSTFGLAARSPGLAILKEAEVIVECLGEEESV